MHCDNITGGGIANDTAKKQRSRSMEMRFFWITDQVRLGRYLICSGTRAKKTCPIILQNIFVLTIKRYALGTYTMTTLLASYPMQHLSNVAVVNGFGTSTE